MAANIATLVPLTLPEDMVRVVFPITQPELGDPGLPTLPALLADVDFRWNYGSAAGTPVTVTFGFSSDAPTYDFTGYVPDTGTYRAFTEGEADSVRAVFAAYEAVCGITFEEVETGAQMVCRVATIQGAVGVGNFPPFNAGSSEQPGDFYIDTGAAGQAYIAFHEIGHSLGLAHAYDDYKPMPEDYGITGSRILSVVDQNSVPMPFYIYDNGPGYGRSSIFHPTTPMPLDILALQMLYGENSATNVGNTVYEYDVNPNFYETIWDGGGNDTIDRSNQTNSCLITLVEGSYSSIGLRDPFAGLPEFILDAWVDDATHNGDLAANLYNDGSNSLAIAFNCVIENATGGSAADRLLGNVAANRLLGNGGNDSLAGGSGNDSLTGGAGNDNLAGDAGNDTLNGGSGNDALNGGTGTDRVLGDAGNDSLTWGAGDTFDGGAGIDTFKFSGASLDLTTAANPNSKLLNFEQVDLRAGAHTLKIARADVLDMSSTSTIKILGDASDTVNIVGAQVEGGAAPAGFTRYKSGAAILIIDSDIQVI